MILNLSGMIGVSVGLVLILALPAVLLLAQRFDMRSGISAGHWVLALSLPVAGRWLFRTGRRMSQAHASTIMTEDRRPCVLLLRPFRTDGMVADPKWRNQWAYLTWLFGRTSFEERLAAIMENVGPPVALGRPAELLPMYGFARLYASHSEWRDVVRSQLGRAGWAVVLMMDHTESFRWELQEVRSKKYSLRTLFVLPPPAGRTAEWRRAYAQARMIVPALPDASDDIAAVLLHPSDRVETIRMDGPITTQAQLVAIRDALVPRYL
jgi:hypothetical protein